MMASLLDLDAGESDPRHAGDTEVAIVVFSGESSLKRLRLLRSGFRHCFVLVRRQGCWIVYDPLSHRTNLAVVTGPTSSELVEWYREKGLQVVETTVRLAPLCSAPLRPFTCVEAVKRVLGIHAPWVTTPWQLYRYLHSAKNSNFFLDQAP
jgi:hypothetical protein